jgi:hypothetical protein
MIHHIYYTTLNCKQKTPHLSYSILTSKSTACAALRLCVDRVRAAAKSSRSSDYNVIHNKCAAVKIEKKYPTTKQIWMDNHTGPHVAVAAEVRSGKQRALALPRRRHPISIRRGHARPTAPAWLP